MGVSVEREGGIAIAKADGRIDGSNASQFQADLQAVIDESDQALILDFEACLLHQQRRSEGSAADGQDARGNRDEAGAVLALGADP